MVTHRPLTDVRWVESDPSNPSGKTSSNQNKDSFALLWSSNSRHSPYGPKGKVGIRDASARSKGGRCRKQTSQFTDSSDNEYTQAIDALIREATISRKQQKHWHLDSWILHNANVFCTLLFHFLLFPAILLPFVAQWPWGHRFGFGCLWAACWRVWTPRSHLKLHLLCTKVWNVRLSPDDHMAIHTVWMEHYIAFAHESKEQSPVFRSRFWVWPRFLAF